MNLSLHSLSVLTETTYEDWGMKELDMQTNPPNSCQPNHGNCALVKESVVLEGKGEVARCCRGAISFTKAASWCFLRPFVRTLQLGLSFRGAMSGATEERPGVALIGFGRMGRIHFEALQANQHLYRLAYLIDELKGPLLEAKVRYRLLETEVVGVEELNRVLEDSSVSGVVICTPTTTHFDLIRTCLAAGKHVMCEKPIGMDLGQVQICYE